MWGRPPNPRAAYARLDAKRLLQAKLALLLAPRKRQTGGAPQLLGRKIDRLAPGTDSFHDRWREQPQRD